MKKKWPIFLPDIANYTATDWAAWFCLTMAVGALLMGLWAAIS